MSNYLTAAKVAENQQWQKRCGMVAINTAVDILAESAETTNHAARVRLATSVLRSEQTTMQAIPRIVLTNEVVRAAAVGGSDLTGESVVDSDLEYVVATIWDATATSLFPA